MAICLFAGYFTRFLFFFDHLCQLSALIIKREYRDVQLLYLSHNTPLLYLKRFVLCPFRSQPIVKLSDALFVLVLNLPLLAK